MNLFVNVLDTIYKKHDTKRSYIENAVKTYNDICQSSMVYGTVRKLSQHRFFDGYVVIPKAFKINKIDMHSADVNITMNDEFFNMLMKNFFTDLSFVYSVTYDNYEVSQIKIDFLYLLAEEKWDD